MSHKWVLVGVFLIVIFCVVLLVYFGRSDRAFQHSVQEQSGICKNSELFVNNIAIANEYVKVCSQHIELPLVDVLLAVGYSVNWIDDTSAILSNGEKQIQLDLSEIRVIDLDCNENILPCIAGKDLYLCCDPVDKNLILDEITLRFLLFSLGIKMDVVVDVDRVEITTYMRSVDSD